MYRSLFPWLVNFIRSFAMPRQAVLVALCSITASMAAAIGISEPLAAPSDIPGQFDTFSEAFEYLQGFAVAHGFAVVRRRCSNYFQGVPRCYGLVCACGGKPYRREASRLRTKGSRKTDCPFQCKITQNRRNWDAWEITIECGEHNHPANRAAAFPEHRRLTEEQKNQVIVQIHDLNCTSRAIIQSLRGQDPDILATEADINNIRIQYHHERFGGHTTTQALITKLDA